MGKEDSRIVQVTPPAPTSFHNNNKRPHQPQSGQQQQQQQNNMYVLKSGKLSFSIHAQYYDKLKSLFMKHLDEKDKTSSGGGGFKMMAKHKSVIKANELLFHEKLFNLLLRHDTSSPSFNVSLNGTRDTLQLQRLS
jgi:hypothetical protein